MLEPQAAGAAWAPPGDGPPLHRPQRRTQLHQFGVSVSPDWAGRQGVRSLRNASQRGTTGCAEGHLRRCRGVGRRLASGRVSAAARRRHAGVVEEELELLIQGRPLLLGEVLLDGPASLPASPRPVGSPRNETRFGTLDQGLVTWRSLAADELSELRPPCVRCRYTTDANGAREVTALLE